MSYRPDPKWAADLAEAAEISPNSWARKPMPGHRKAGTTQAKGGSLREQIFDRDGWCCAHCGRGKKLTIDHVVPKALGGKNVHRNLQTLCGPCNIRKGANVDLIAVDELARRYRERLQLAEMKP